jgi:hypothetical protein
MDRRLLRTIPPMSRRCIVKTKRDGPFIYYELADVRMLDVLGMCSIIIEASAGGRKSVDHLFSCRTEFIKFLNEQ